MGREILEPGCLYHVYNHAVGREKLFLSEDNYHYFLRRYEHFISPVADMYAYCLMTNHIHFLVEVKSPIHIPENTRYSENQFVSRQFANLFSSYSQAFNKQQGRLGNLFISNFKRSKIDRDEYLTNVIKYIHLNPVKQGAVRNVWQWKFSSYNVLCSEGESFLAKAKTLAWFGGLAEFKKFHSDCENLRDGLNLPESLKLSGS
jgi:REP element-mobilizing transposase RayT